MTANMWVATLAWTLLILGYLQRRNRRRHIPLMLTGIFIDIGLVFYLQITRSAIQTAVSFSLSWIRQLHVISSTLAFVLYFPVLASGWKLATGRGGRDLRRQHIRLATTALVLRTLGFLLMFSLWKFD